ncbi:ExsB family protein [Winogradskyella sp. PC-19]|uniref:N-acetyl sugar amidotransferase n=1 Tax=Winogradskyella sp. PC-19 TaxID=754417 RepID=UPI000B3C99C9|nr:N-acetyl sugar amidotransferase [Winogradskyella sp. PC-19]ARV09686.1 ExsB family protein [Winogradskyella sp. PC-19]
MNLEENKQNICSRCVMDGSDPEITYNSQGVCNHCERYDSLVQTRTFSGDVAKTELSKVIASIKASGKNKEYDCIIGVSGGVDSTYVAYRIKEMGLNPLAIHFDNGWNSELAVSNIEKTLDKLDIDLHTYVIDWDVFSDLQKAFLNASTPDGEIPTDHAINALLFKEASKRGIKYIISGMNFATESMAVRMWSYGHSDWTYIKDVYKKFGNGQSLKPYPHFSFFDLFNWTFLKRIKVVSILNYMDYNKDEAMEVLKNELDWVYYGGKHYESVYTRFYQGYILPKKFNIDKRRGHVSDLIRAGQLTRKEALKELEKETYPSAEMLNHDMDFVHKKFDYTEKEFNQIMKQPTKSFLEFKNKASKVDKIKLVLNFLRKKGILSK